MEKVIVFFITVLCVFTAFGETVTDSVKIHFRVNQSLISPEISENAVLMENFIKRLTVLNDSNKLDNVTIYGYASPEGPLKRNEQLALQRCEAVAAEILRRTSIDPTLLKIIPGGEAWAELAELLRETEAVNRKDEILEILTTPGLKGVERIEKIKKIDNGRAYKRLLDLVFPRLRYSKAVVDYTKTVVPSLPIEVPIPSPEKVDSVATDTIIEVVSPDIPEVPAVAICNRDQLFAIKTNLLYYLALMPNLSIEWLIDRNWSVAVEGNMAWWSNESKFKCYRIATVDAEGRRWFRQRDYWHGFYAGAFAGWGLYDLENGGNGHQGEGVMAGVTLGFMWPIRCNLSFEAGIGVGYLHTRDREYMPFEGHYVFQRSKYINYFGPLKVKFSLVWRFLDRDKVRKKGGLL